jgi:hypothetical protein
MKNGKTIMNNELDSMWDVTFVAYVKTLYCAEIFLEELSDTTKIQSSLTNYACMRLRFSRP